MRKIILITLLLLTQWSYPQQKKDKDARFQHFKIEQQKYIAKEAAITEQEGELFFPIYFELMKSSHTIHRQMRNYLRKQKIEQLNEADAKKLFEKVVRLRELMKEKEDNYYRQAKKIIPIKKLLLVIKAEEGFRRDMLKKRPKKRNKE